MSNRPKRRRTPPIYDYSHSAAAFEDHMAYVFSQPCPHCDQVADLVRIPLADDAIAHHCTACLERRAMEYPHG